MARDEAKIAFEAFQFSSASQLIGPNDLKDMRERKEKERSEHSRLKQDAEDLKKSASLQWSTFLALWDFFKDMGMLPFLPGTDKLWSDPDAFRRSLGGDGEQTMPTPAIPQTSEARVLHGSPADGATY